jgi:hypothetical protein
MNNVIVMTIGWTGSSVLTGLLARGGLSTGQATMKKVDYDTFENLELTELNKRVIRESGCDIDYAISFSWRAIGKVASAAEHIDTEPYRAFVAGLGAQRPWVWKDPRLWLTIRFWQRLMSFSDVKFVWLTRDDLQLWISANIRRQIIGYRYSKRYNAQVNASIEAFLEMNALPYVKLSFEDLVLRPEAALDGLNAFLGSRLDLADLRAVYHAPLYRSARGVGDLALAAAIHGKNYLERIDERTALRRSLPG